MLYRLDGYHQSISWEVTKLPACHPLFDHFYPVVCHQPQRIQIFKTLHPGEHANGMTLYLSSERRMQLNGYRQALFYSES